MPEEKKNKPSNTLFKQQRLPAWQPILAPPHITGCFLLIFAIFLPIGIAIFAANNRVVDIEFRYDNAGACAPNQFHFVSDNSSMGCQYQLSFQVPQRMVAPVYLYYKLTNFYQNHRRYVSSRNEQQLAGQDVPSSSMSDASPLLTPQGGIPVSVNGRNATYDDFVYSPAGLIAWSLFNDTFELRKFNVSSPSETPTDKTATILICNTTRFRNNDSTAILTGGNETNLCHKNGIAWDSDKKSKFATPTMSDTIWTARRDNYGAPIPTTNSIFLANGWYANETGHNVPVSTDEDLMVWMRTASLPEFRKLFRIIDVDLEAGPYLMTINSMYDVSGFEGTKSFALATVSWVGGKNEFLAVIFIIVGVCAFVAGGGFMLVHKICGDRTQRAIDELMSETK